MHNDHSNHHHWWGDVSVWHERLPPPLDGVAASVLLRNVPHADEWLFAALVLLWVAAVVQLRAFARPPPVPLKRLPRRPALCFQFRPDDPVTVNLELLPRSSSNHNHSRVATTGTTSGGGGSLSHSTSSVTSQQPKQQPQQPLPKKASFIQRIDDLMHQKWLFRNRATAPTRGAQLPPENASAAAALPATATTQGMVSHVETVPYVDTDDEDYDDVFSPPGRGGRVGAPVVDHPTHGSPDAVDDGATNEAAPFVVRVPEDLPDSFAPLLSSSHMTVVSHQLTADLVHAVQCEAGVRLRPGRHELPLDQDGSRPQLGLHVSATGCRLSAVAVVGSDGLSNEQDMDVTRLTRSKPMVKHAGLVLDPPLALSNVAPTLIHFPTLFEDRNMIPVLRRMQLVRFLVDFVVSISSFLEKCLWILESQCQIHLSKVRITPLYKGQHKQHHRQRQERVAGNDAGGGVRPLPNQPSPEWRLQLAFSGHVLLFGYIPIPFISVTLPSFIIPQPHALLEFLLSA